MKQVHKNLRHQYVITKSGRVGPSVSALLRDYEGVEVLEELDSSTVLAEMSDDALTLVTREIPQLVFEPNIQYRILSQ
jgi:hypothetical protein